MMIAQVEGILPKMVQFYAVSGTKSALKRGWPVNSSGRTLPPILCRRARIGHLTIRHGTSADQRAVAGLESKPQMPMQGFEPKGARRNRGRVGIKLRVRGISAGKAGGDGGIRTQKRSQKRARASRSALCRRQMRGADKIEGSISLPQKKPHRPDGLWGFFWRRRRDSNPRYAFGAYNGLANRRLQPLGHVSACGKAYSFAVSPSNGPLKSSQTSESNKRWAAYLPAFAGRLRGRNFLHRNNHE